MIANVRNNRMKDVGAAPQGDKAFVFSADRHDVSRPGLFGTRREP
jgi:hypothetical protein